MLMKKIVLAKDLEPEFTSALHFLHRSDITVHTAATADELLKTHFEHRADLIVTRLELHGMQCETMINVIRRNEALKSVSIMVLYDDDPVQRARSARCGANIVMAMPADPALLAAHVSQLLSVEPRRAYRVVLNMAVNGVHQNKPFLCNSENVSPRGLLIRTAELLAPGSRIACSFYLPDGTRVSADGDEARVIKQGTDNTVHHYGVRFISIAPEAEASLSSFVHQ
jgi:DNA-binding response OmpR family regulator